MNLLSACANHRLTRDRKRCEQLPGVRRHDDIGSGADNGAENEPGYRNKTRTSPRRYDFRLRVRLTSRRTVAPIVSAAAHA